MEKEYIKHFLRGEVKMRKVIILLLFVILIFPVNVAANTVVPGEIISSIDTKFKQLSATAKQSKQVQQLAKQMKGQMSERKKRMVLTYSGTWYDVYEDFENALLSVLLEDEYLAYDYRGYSYTTNEKKGQTDDRCHVSILSNDKST